MKISIFLIGILISGFTTATAQSVLQKSVSEFVAYEPFKNASITLKIVDVDNGVTLGDFDSQRALPPASTVKLFSTATAFEILGSQYKPCTKLYLDGEVKNGTLFGNLIIKGEGDPTLGSNYFFEGKESEFLNEWVAKIKNLGIREIKGQIISDGSSFGYQGVPDDWTWSDMGNYYGSGPSGICLYDNMLKYYFQTNSAGDKAILRRTFPQLDSLLFLNNIVSANVKGDNSYIYGAPYSYDRLGTGKLPANRSEFMVKGSLPDPELQLAIELYNVLKTNNISVYNGYDNVRKRIAKLNDIPDYSNLEPFHIHYGKTIQEICELTNFKSINLFAEQVLCLTGFQKTKDGSTEAGLNQLYLYWKEKISTKGLYIKDGSGLSRSNAISADHFCDLLIQMHRSKNGSNFKNTLPTVGESGTVAGMCKGTPAQGRVKAKSGTMNRIKSYAGYATTLTGKNLAFAIVVNNYNCSNSATTEQIEKLMVAMVKDL